MTFQTCVAVWLGAVNLILFALMGADKAAARHGRRRIPETTLLTLAALGGSIGGLLGMSVFHHKTRKSAFVIGFPVIFLAQLALVYFFLRGA